jgi:single-stranded-DNA-specific exonuclease
MTPPQKWHILSFEKNALSAMQKTYSISPYFSKVLIDRDITTNAAIQNVISPGVQSLHPPSLLPDIEGGCERIQQAIKQGEHILIWGDEDTDGITATVFLYELLSNLNARVDYHIPSRRNEGIGLNAKGLQNATAAGASLIITVDCSPSDAALIAQARAHGVDVVVTDHHEAETTPENHYTMINPKRKDSGYPFRNIAGVTVAFKLGWELAQSMLSLSDGEWQSIAAEWFPLVLLGTYGDKVPLQDENWTLAHLGFCALKKTRRKGLRMLTDMLSEESGLDETVLQKMISVFSAGKTEGWGENRSFRILTETEESFLRETITELVRRSDEWHAQANDNFKRMVSEIGEELSNDIISIYTPQVAFEYLGFCASRLKERYGKPIVAMSDKGDSIVGEARAPRGVNIHRVLAEKSHLFSSFGGHRPACGFTLERAKLDELRTFLSQDFPEFAARKQQSAEMRIVDVLPLSKLSEQLKRELVSLAPFGVENPPPLFLAKQVSLSKGIYTYTAPETGAVKRIEMKSDSQSWTGIDGKPIELDIVYYFNSAGTLTIADARPSLFNEPHIES